MDVSTTLVTIISTVAGGGVGALLTYKLGNRKQDQTDFTALVSEYKDLVISYKSEVEKLRVEVGVFRNDLAVKEKEIILLRNQLMIFESSHTDVPVPIWLKDTSGKMLFLNDEYERVVLHPVNKDATDYIGSTDFDVWDSAVAKVFVRHDKKIMRTKKPEELIESWPGSDGVVWEARIIKYPRFSGKTVVGIGGIMVERWEQGEKI